MVKHPKKLLELIKELARRPAERAKLAVALHDEAKLDSAKRLAEIVVEAAMKDLKNTPVKVETEHAGR
jgi:hypothetical protein